MNCAPIFSGHYPGRLDKRSQGGFTGCLHIYSMAVGALRLAMQDANIYVPIERRQCKASCTCETYWESDYDCLFKMFDPKI